MKNFLVTLNEVRKAYLAIDEKRVVAKVFIAFILIKMGISIISGNGGFFITIGKGIGVTIAIFAAIVSVVVWVGIFAMIAYCIYRFVKGDK